MRDPTLINGQISIRQQLQLVITHIGLIAVEVEIDVVCQVHRTGFIDACAVLNRNTIILGEAIGRLCLKLARIALVAVRRGEDENGLRRVLRGNRPAALVKAFRTAVQLMLTLAWRKLDRLPVQRIAAVGDTVSIAANRSAEERRLLGILFRRRTAQQRFAHAAVFHRNARRQKRGAPIH